MGMARPFTTHEVAVQKGDEIFVFSDGYADQFGGPKGKKFKYRPFQNLLLELHHRPMAEQKPCSATPLMRGCRIMASIMSRLMTSW